MNIYAQGVNIGQEFGSRWGVSAGFGDLISIFLSISITIAGIIIVFFIVFGGIKMIQSAGSGDARGAEQGKKALTYALLGFIIVFTAYWIIQLFETIIGVQFLSDPLYFLTPGTQTGPGI